MRTRKPGAFSKTLVAIMFIGCMTVGLIVPLYNRAEPALFGIPFFYWFQFVWIAVTGVATAIAYWLKI